jgi:hypothetical protein
MSDQDDEPWSSHGGLPNRIIIQSGFSAVVCGVGGFCPSVKGTDQHGAARVSKRVPTAGQRRQSKSESSSYGRDWGSIEVQKHITPREYLSDIQIP